MQVATLPGGCVELSRTGDSKLEKLSDAERSEAELPVRD
jgi:hypothetical protein